MFFVFFAFGLIYNMLRVAAYFCNLFSEQKKFLEGKRENDDKQGKGTELLYEDNLLRLRTKERYVDRHHALNPPSPTPNEILLFSAQNDTADRQSPVKSHRKLNATLFHCIKFFFVHYFTRLVSDIISSLVCLE